MVPHRFCGIMLIHLPGALLVDPLLVLVGGLLLDALVGDMPLLFRHVPHPVVLIGRAIAWFDVRLNREQRSEKARRTRGIVTVAILIVGAALAGLLIDLVCRHLAYGWLVELVIIAVLVAQRSLFQRVRAVGAALAEKGLYA